MSAVENWEFKVVITLGEAAAGQGAGNLSTTAGLNKLNMLLRLSTGLLRSLGLSPDQRQAIQEMRRAITILRTLQMVSSGSSLMAGGLRMATSLGIGPLSKGARVARHIKNLEKLGEI